MLIIRELEKLKLLDEAIEHLYVIKQTYEMLQQYELMQETNSLIFNTKKAYEKIKGDNLVTKSMLENIYDLSVDDLKEMDRLPVFVVEDDVSYGYFLVDVNSQRLDGIDGKHYDFDDVCESIVVYRKQPGIL